MPKRRAFLDVTIDGAPAPSRLVFELHADECPKTCDNFATLCVTKAYVSTPFHRIIRGFMAQGGDTTAGDGTGGVSIYGGGTFDDEDTSSYSHNARGVLSMANAGPNTNGSQFFFTFAAADHLTGKHTVFGRILGADSMDVLSEIERLPADKGDRPLTQLSIASTTVMVNPFARLEQAKLDAAKEKAKQLEAVEAAKARMAEGEASKGPGAVGKYLKIPPRPAMATGAGALPRKKKKKASGYGDFSAF